MKFLIKQETPGYEKIASHENEINKALIPPT